MISISIIIPTYNSAQFLPDALESIMRQSYQDFEVIIVDDGSTDDTAAIVSNYERKFPGKIRYSYQINEGPASARNLGIQQARGELIAFLDADDLLLNDSLLKRKTCFDKNQNLNLVFSDYDLQVGEQEVRPSRLSDSKFLEFFNHEIEHREDEQVVLGVQFFSRYLEFSPLPIWTGTVMMRKAVSRDIGLFRKDISVAEDVEYWLRIIKGRQVGYINTSLSCYRYYLGSLSKQTERYSLNTAKVFEELYASVRDRSIRKVARRRLALSYCNLGKFYRDNASYVQAVQYLLKSIIAHPGNSAAYKTLGRLFIPRRQEKM